MKTNSTSQYLMRTALPADEALIQTARSLFMEYAKSLNFSLCFQDFDEEVAHLPGDYAPPNGRLILVYDGPVALGCIALRKIEDGICEMKRLYLKPEARGKGLGRKLAADLIAEAVRIGYTKMRLDTVPSMTEAISLYRSLGFRDVRQYTKNPIEGALFMELELAKSA
ncbi:MAG TPA: GNAT family N-acetyltransferase [Candidatus Kryptonia bacterium]